MKLLVIGATGRTGQLVVEEALRRGDRVVAYARHPQSITPRADLTIIGGELNQPNRLTEALRGVDAVVCCLGPKMSPRGFVGTSVMTDSLPLIAAAMQATGVRRLVILSAFGVGRSAQRAGVLPRLVFSSIMHWVYGDKVRGDKTLRGYALDTTWVLPGTLSNEANDPDADVRPLSQVQHVKGMPVVSRATVARVLVDAAHDPATIDQQLVVTPKGSIQTR